MPSFDIESKVDQHELTNAIDQANRVIGNRFDFKGTDSEILHNENKITLKSQQSFQIDQMLPILKESLAKRGIDIKCLSEDATIESNNQASKEIIVNEGISQDIGRIINLAVKSSKIKVQSSIQGDTVRISGRRGMTCNQLWLKLNRLILSCLCNLKILGINGFIESIFSGLFSEEKSTNYIIGLFIWDPFRITDRSFKLLAC
jgi:uncharacterized protein YajQ (UPF0234 family)